VVSVLDRYGVVLALLGAGTLAAVVVLVRGGVDPSQVGRVYVLSVGCVALCLLVQWIRRLSREGPWQWTRSQPAATSLLPAELKRLQDSLRASRASRTQFDVQTRPLLCQVAADRLRLVGIAMEHDPDRAAATLGPRLSEMVLESPADASPTSRRAPSKRELAEILDELEGLGA
jgi:hypothetical protein